MSDLYLFRVYCTGSSSYETVWSSVAPQICPSDGSGIDTSQTCILDKHTIGDVDLTSGPTYYLSTGGGISGNTTGGAINVYLPDASGIYTNKTYTFFNDGTFGNPINIYASGSDTIDGSNPYVLTDQQIVTLISDGNDWQISSDTIGQVTSQKLVITSTAVAPELDLYYQNTDNLVQFRGITGSDNILIAPNANQSLTIQVDFNDAGTGPSDVWSAAQIVSYITTGPTGATGATGFFIFIYFERFLEFFSKLRFLFFLFYTFCHSFNFLQNF